MEPISSFASRFRAEGVAPGFPPDFALRLLTHIPLDAVRLVYDRRWDRIVDPGLLPQALERWAAANADRQERGLPPLEDHPLFRPMAIERRNGHLVIRSGRTSYFVNFALQRPSPTWVDDLVVGAGMSVVPVCRDGAVLLGRRSRIVAVGHGQWHVVGGHAHPDPRFEADGAGLAPWALEELQEEMGIQEGDIQALAFLGLGIDLTISKPEFLLKAALREPSASYIAAWERRRTEHPEFTEITTLDALACQSSPASATSPGDHPLTLEAITGLKNKLVPACRAALVALLCSAQEGPWRDVAPYLARPSSMAWPGRIPRR